MPPSCQTPLGLAALLSVLGLTGLNPVPSAAAPSPANWPAVRGPHRGGVPGPADQATAGQRPFPIHFGPKTNLVWQVGVPSGHSSPILWGNHLFLTGFEANQLLVLALNRATGAEQWRRALDPGPVESGSRLSHPATATPTTDGDRVISYFAPFGLVAHDLEGRELWRHPLPTPVTQHGASSSPVLAGGLVLQLCDQDTDSYLLALDRATGRQVWRTERPGFRRGFSTPLPWPPENPEVAVVAGTLRLAAYQLSDGKERWTVHGLPNEMVASPIGGAGWIYLAGWTSGSGVPRMPTWTNLITQGDTDGDGLLAREEAPQGPARNHFAYLDADKDGKLSAAEYETVARVFDQSQNVAMAVQPEGTGDLTSTRVRWRQKRGLPYVPTPLFHHDRLYLVRNGGLVSCLDARTGEFRYQEERLGALGDYYASPVAAGDQVLVIAQPGTAVVYRTGDTLEVLARNSLGEEVLATPAIVDRTLYVRTKTSQFAFREPQPSE